MRVADKAVRLVRTRTTCAYADHDEIAKPVFVFGDYPSRSGRVPKAFVSLAVFATNKTRRAHGRISSGRTRQAVARNGLRAIFYSLAVHTPPSKTNATSASPEPSDLRTLRGGVGGGIPCAFTHARARVKSPRNWISRTLSSLVPFALRPVLG